MENGAVLIHLVGFGTGTALYSLLLWLAMRARHQEQSPKLEDLPLLAGVLGVIWNLGGLAQLFGATGSEREWISAISYSALGFLPAVVVHSVIRQDARGTLARAERFLVGAGYGLSALGTFLQLRAAVWNIAASQQALRLLTVGFVALAVPLLLLTRRQRRAERTWWIASLAIFAISGFHMATSHLGDYRWPLELVGHHASLPLAFAILFFDYRFAFADLFLKRALSLVTLVAVVSTLFFAVTASGVDEGSVGMLVAVSILTTLMYPALRSGIHSFVDRVVLRRPDYALVRAEIAAMTSELDDIPLLLDRSAEKLGRALLAMNVFWVESGPDADRSPHRIPIPSAESPRFAFTVALQRGRRLLSDDAMLLETAAGIVARRIDAIRLLSERVLQGAREEEMRKLTVEAELRALRAQINPHFLFNALNTISYLIGAAPDRALDTLRRLTELLRRVLGSSNPVVPFRDELTIVRSYLDIERARFEERLRVTINVPEAAQRIHIPTLIVQPLVENAVKHGISNRKSGGEISIEADLSIPEMLRIRVRDTGAGASEHALRRGRAKGVGLVNIEQRLRAHYGEAASLTIDSTPDVGTQVTVVLPATERSALRKGA